MTENIRSRQNKGRSVGLLALVAAIALIVGGLAGFLLWGIPSSTTARQDALPDIDKPTIVTEAQLKKLSAYLGPIYWAGADTDSRYEFTLAAGGAVYVRYLPSSAQTGTKNEYLTVATYRSSGGPVEDFSTVDGAIKATSGALILQKPEAPKSAYFSFPGANFQVEVFSPKTGEALDLVESGTVTLVSSQ